MNEKKIKLFKIGTDGNGRQMYQDESGNEYVFAFSDIFLIDKRTCNLQKRIKFSTIDFIEGI